MRLISLSILLSISFFVTSAQDCETGWKIFGYDETKIVKTGSNASVFLTAYDEESFAAPTDYHHKVYIWDFGDGSPSTSQIVYFQGNYTGETHIYNLNNPSIVRDGIFGVSVHLKILYYKNFIETLEPLECYVQDELVTYVIPTSDFSVSLIADPVYNTYPLNKPINLFYNIVTKNYSSTDNLTYKLQKDGFDIINGSVTDADLNKNVSLPSYTPTQAGAYTFNFTLSRYGTTVGTAYPLIINVGSDTTRGSSAGSGSCLCSDLRPDFKLSYSIDAGGQVALLVTDNCSAEFRRVYVGKCAQYAITFTRSDGYLGIIQALTDYTGFGITSRIYVTQPDVYQPPHQYSVLLEMTCLSKNGETLAHRVSKSITVPPRTFNPSENTINLSPNGQPVSISSHSTCYSTITRNPNDPADDMKWIKNFTLGSNITFTADANYEPNARMAEIVLFTNNNLDQCVDIVNGVKKSYRTINLYQPTLVHWTYPTEPFIGPSIDFPTLVIPANTDFYCLTFKSDGAKYFFRDLTRLHLDYLKTNDKLTIGYYDKNGISLGTQDIRVGISKCTGWDVNSLGSLWNSYDYVVVQSPNATENLNGTYYIPLNKSFTMFCSHEINLEEGFDVSEGAFFDAGIEGCTLTKSTKETTQESMIHTQPPIALAKTDSAYYQSENIVVYPNPSNGSFIIENRTPTPIISAEIINGQGTTIKIMNHLENKQKVDVSDSPAGLYLLRIRTSNGVVEKKIIINVL